MKKRLALLWALLLALCLTACTGSGPSGGAVELPTVPASTPVLATDPAPEDTSAPASTPVSESTNAPESTPNPDPSGSPGESGSGAQPAQELLPEDGSYTSKEDVALYLFQYGRLPDNFITKSQARQLGWSGGSLEPYAPGKCIGGDRFGNYEGLLPEAQGRSYTECDIDTLGASSRGAKRLVFSNDGLIYYTGDHYESFELLYGEE